MSASGNQASGTQASNASVHKKPLKKGSTRASKKRKNGKDSTEVESPIFNQTWHTTMLYEEFHPDDPVGKPQDPENPNEKSVQTGIPWRLRRDLFIWSIVSLFCFPFIGICAIFYSIRANNASDFNLHPRVVRRNNFRARSAVLYAILLGIIIVGVALVIAMSSFIAKVSYRGDERQR